MGSVRSRRLRRWSAAALLISVVGVGQAMIGGTPAQARCAGVNNLVDSTVVLGVNGAPGVIEKPTAGTCNNDGYYSAIFSAAGSGYQASVWINNGGGWVGFYGQPGNAWYSYHYTSPPGSTSKMVLCRNKGQDWHCGWGPNSVDAYIEDFTFYGVNQGY